MPAHEFVVDSSGPTFEIPPAAAPADEETADPEARVRAWQERAERAEQRAAERTVPGYIYDSLLRSYQELREGVAPRSDHQVLVSVAQLLEENLAELKHINSKLAIVTGESRSSATVKTSARGYDLDCKSYADGLENEALDNAIAMYARGMRELDALKANDWRQTVEAEQAKREAVAP